MLLLFLTFTIGVLSQCGDDCTSYLQQRSKLLQSEQNRYFDSNIKLSPEEAEVGEFLNKLRVQEIQSYLKKGEFLTGQNFRSVKNEIGTFSSMSQTKIDRKLKTLPSFPSNAQGRLVAHPRFWGSLESFANGNL